MSNCLCSHYSTNRTESQGKSSEERDSTPQSSAFVLIDDDELTDSELLRFMMNTLDDVWNTQCHQQRELKKIHKSLREMQEIITDISAVVDLSNVESTLIEILTCLKKVTKPLGGN